MSEKKIHREKPAPTRRTGYAVVGVFDAYLEWCRLHKVKRTCDSYRERIQSFVAFMTAEYRVSELAVEDLRPFPVQEWVDSHPTWSDGMKRGCIVAVQRAFNPQAKLGRIDRSPVAHMAKPRQGKRDQIITPEEFDALLARVLNQNFRDVREFSWLTGARPQETIIIEARHVEAQHGRVVIPPEEAKGKKHFRVICLCGKAVEIVKRLVAAHPVGTTFRNTDGKFRHPYAVNCSLNRLQTASAGERLKAVGVKVEEDAVAALPAELRRRHGDTLAVLVQRLLGNVDRPRPTS